MRKIIGPVAGLVVIAVLCQTQGIDYKWDIFDFGTAFCLLMAGMVGLVGGTHDSLPR